MTAPKSKRPAGALMDIAHRAWRQGVSPATLYRLIEKASEDGAARALGELGLQDGRASGDIGELRALLDGWRDAKRTMRRMVIRWLIRLLLTSLLLGLAIKMKIISFGPFQMGPFPGE